MNPARSFCEDVLRKDREYNIEHEIWPSNVAVVDRLLQRGLELERAYQELVLQLKDRPRALQAFLGLVLDVATQWSPAKLREARDARAQLVAVNERIGDVARTLAQLLRERLQLENGSGFTSGTYYHVCDVIEAASEHNGLYRSYLKEGLDALHSQFDLKYWPPLHALVTQIGLDARRGQPKALDPVTAEGTKAARASLTDYFRSLYTAINENRRRSSGPLPGDFELTDASIAALANCSLDLPPEECVDGPYVKQLRQRIGYGKGGRPRA